jgi:GMP synthase-like glutamine amidotransferase
MRLHCIQHVPFENVGNIGVWAADRGHALKYTRMYRGEPLPERSEFDWLVVMGGPMGVHDTDAFPWLRLERDFLAETVSHDRIVLGVCLGAQLIADALGAPVGPNGEKEIGWFPVRLTEGAGESPVFAVLPEKFTAFHWHGDTFGMPSGALHTATSNACANQAFAWGERVYGLQFHLEYSFRSIQTMVENCFEDLAPSPHVQTPAEMLYGHEHVDDLRELLFAFLDAIAADAA